MKFSGGVKPAHDEKEIPANSVQIDAMIHGDAGYDAQLIQIAG